MLIENQTKMPFFDMKNAKDLYKKLEYDFNILTNDKMNNFNYMNFIFTASHLKDWVNEDKNESEMLKVKVNEVFNFDSNLEYSTIRSLCNKSKHFYLKKEYEKEMIREEGFDFGKIDFSNFSFNPIYYYVEVRDKKVELYDVCKKVFEDWSKVIIGEENYEIK